MIDDIQLYLRSSSDADASKINYLLRQTSQTQVLLNKQNR